MQAKKPKMPTLFVRAEGWNASRLAKRGVTMPKATRHGADTTGLGGRHDVSRCQIRRVSLANITCFDCKLNVECFSSLKFPHQNELFAKSLVSFGNVC